MTKAQEFTKIFTDMASQFPMDANAFSDAVHRAADLGEKVSAVALEAARSNAEITGKWTEDTLDRLGEFSVSGKDATDCAKSVNSFASASMETAAGHLAAYSEVARKAQTDTVDLVLGAGK